MDDIVSGPKTVIDDNISSAEEESSEHIDNE